MARMGDFEGVLAMAPALRPAIHDLPEVGENIAIEAWPGSDPTDMESVPPSLQAPPNKTRDPPL